MNRILFYILITTLFLNACTSSKSLTNCPNFKKTKSFKTVVKSTDKKKKKRIKKENKAIERLAKIEQKSDKKVEKLSKKFRNRLEKKSVIAKLKQLPEHEMKTLHEALSELNITEFEKDLKRDVAIGQNYKSNDIFQDEILFEDQVLIQYNNSPTTYKSKLKNKAAINPASKKLQNSEYKKANGFAIASLVCGIVSLIFAGVILGILGIVFGAVAMGKIKREPSKWSGKGMAIAGLVCGIIGAGLALLIIVSI